MRVATTHLIKKFARFADPPDIRYQSIHPPITVTVRLQLIQLRRVTKGHHLVNHVSF